MSMQRVMGGRGLERGPRGSKRAHSRGTIVLFNKELNSCGKGLSGQTSSRGSTKTASQWAWRVFHSVSVPHGASTVRGRGGAAPEPRRRQVCMVVAKEDERRTNVGSACIGTHVTRALYGPAGGPDRLHSVCKRRSDTWEPAARSAAR